MKKVFILCIVLLSVLSTFAQPRQSVKMEQLFIDYMVENLTLTPQELSQLRVLVPEYFNGLKKIHQNFKDPLIKDQQRATLKVDFRNTLTPVLGRQRAGRFFILEQQFRKKVKDELKQRTAVS